MKVCIILGRSLDITRFSLQTARGRPPLCGLAFARKQAISPGETHLSTFSIGFPQADSAMTDHDSTYDSSVMDCHTKIPEKVLDSGEVLCYARLRVPL